MEDYIFIDATKEELVLIEGLEPIKAIDDCLPRVGAPCYKVDKDLIEFKKKLEKDAKYDFEFLEESRLKSLTPEQLEIEKQNKKEEEGEGGVIEYLKETIIGENIKYVYCLYEDYTSASLKVTRPDQSKPLTNIELLAIYTRGYQWIYEEEEREVGKTGHIEGLLNRDQSHGRYGIWGHDIEDLIYNGCYVITVYSDLVCCEFSVDS